MASHLDPFVMLDGDLVPAAEARVSVFDRGFLFSHAVYEVTAVYGGRLVDFDGHMSRLARSLKGLEIPDPHQPEEWERLHRTLMQANEMDEGLVYLQVTSGGLPPRDFAGPETFSPTVVLFTTTRRLVGQEARDGVSVILQEDTRWKRRDLKTTQLLSQALAYRAAKSRNAFSAWMLEDGKITEAASANAWIVSEDGEIITRDLSPAILAGITRSTVLKHAEEEGLRVLEHSFSPEELMSAREAFTTSAGALIIPVVEVDGAKIGDGQPGPITRGVQRRYYEEIGMDVGREAPWAL